MSRELVLATRNAGKVAELRRILDGLGIQLRSAADLGLEDVEETGTSFEENALLKARACALASGLPAVADDSGLVVDALGGEPGIRSARYSGVHGDDAANLELVLRRMEGLADRRARFVCAAALATPAGEDWVVTEALEGRLTERPRGEGGFGYDPIFVPDGDNRTTAELPPEQKDAISHRGKAFRALRPFVERLFRD